MRRIEFGRRAGLVAVALAVGVAGCGADEMMKSSESAATYAPSAAAAGAKFAADASASMPAGAEAAPKMVEETAAAGRKIIYNAHVDLVTEDLVALEAKLARLVSEGKAYIADSDRTGSAGVNRRGSWKVRVPVDRYDGFVKGVVGLGELVSMKADSQDVSEEYYDLDARQAAKKVEEDRLLKHLADSTGKLEEILAVERELSRVRTEIERMQGRLRALANLTSLATVTITASEIKGYVPPQAPTLGTRVARAFSESVGSLREFGESVLIWFVSIVPWLPILLIGLAVAAWVVRRLIARFQHVRLIDVPASPIDRR